ncbi:MAG: invasion associated locus B family protein [Proteobacteria bacterium]|nr:invasion associated locus B family protein [Pseudomonadota bacterium]
MKSLRSFFGGAIAATLLTVAAAAQNAPGQPLAPSETKQFGDWMVRCFAVDKSPSPCDMFEVLADKKSGNRILSVSIAYIPSTDKHVIQVAVPLGVVIQKGLLLTSDKYTSPVLHYRRCDRGGCYVEMLLDNAAVDSLASSSGPATVKFVYGDKPFDVPFSLKGFADAHGTMTDLARKKAAGASAPAAPAPDAAPAAGDATPAKP